MWCWCERIAVYHAGGTFELRAVYGVANVDEKQIMTIGEGDAADIAATTNEMLAREKKTTLMIDSVLMEVEI